MTRVTEPGLPTRVTPSVGGGRFGPLVQGSWQAPAAALGGFLLVVVVALALGVGRGAPASAPPVPESAGAVATSPDVASEVRTYAAGVDQVARVAGTILELEMKPALGEVAEQAPVDIDAQGWADQLAALRDGLADKDPPAGLGDAHAGLLAALDGYVEAAETLGRAAATPDRAERELLLERINELGPAADDQWDTAWAAVQAAAGG